MARGPSIKVNHEVPPFDTVDLFSLFSAILKLTSTTNDGSFDNVEDILVLETGSNLLPIIVVIGKLQFYIDKPVLNVTKFFISVGAVLLVLLLILCAAVVTLLIIKRQQNITTTAALNKRFPQNFTHSNIEAKHLLEPEDA